MATLHVRNVPDQLYERLRERATVNGRSIGAEIVIVLENELGVTGVRPWRTMFARRRHAPTPFHHFTPRARNVVAEAKEEARGLGDSAIGTEHLLLALLGSPGTVAAYLLETAGLEYERARATVEGIPRERHDESGGLPFTPGAKKAMELALRYCIELRSSQIGPEHLLLGIAREKDGLGARILLEAGLDVAGLSRGLAVPPELQPYELRVEEGHGFRVIELTGEAQDWERRLNELAARGYELIEIVSQKAIFRVPVQQP
jgi:plasmid stability protein